MTRKQRGDTDRSKRPRRAAGFETQEPPARWVAAGLAGVLAVVVVAGVLVALTFAEFQHLHPAPPANRLEQARLRPPPPRLQPALLVDRARIEGAAAARLRGYGWSDPDHRTAHIPIEAAMRLQAARGWPDPAERP